MLNCSVLLSVRKWTLSILCLSIFFSFLKYGDCFLQESINNILGIVPREQCKMYSVGFPCKYIQKSSSPPDNVNKLQPADIEIVAALGDSVIGSTAALAPNFFHENTEYRGISYAIGGMGTWRTVMTIPNILRVFNPDVEGGAVIFGGPFDRGTNLNLAVPGATSLTLFDQAKRLVRLLGGSRHKDKWKLVTIHIGHNDVCTHPCNTTYTEFDASPTMFRRRLQKSLDYIRDHLPKTFVNYIPLMDVTITEELIDGLPFCSFAVPYVCPCLHGGFGGNPLTRDQMKELQNGYLKEMYNLINSDRYERRDFTVVLQPAFTDIRPFYAYNRRSRKLEPDLTYFGPDCLHPSQKLHALMARALWNNMLSPENEKQTNWSPTPPLLCPTPNSPYLATRSNSRNMVTKGMDSDFATYMRVVLQNRVKCYL